MAVIGIDDTDSATAGMCTTYVATLVAERLAPADATTFLIRLNPAIEHKTRGNGAVGIHTGASVDRAFETARAAIETHARTEDPETNPGLVAVPEDALTPELPRFGVRAIRERCEIDAAEALVGEAGAGVRARGWGNRRGLVGATAAVGAVAAYTGLSGGSPAAFDDRTYEYLAYRPPTRWGTDRQVDATSVRSATAAERPRVWDNVDPATGALACVPRTPCPVLFGIRGDDPRAVERVAERIESEPRPRGRVFITNQGTDAHLRPGTVSRLREGYAYHLGGTVVDEPQDLQGGHVRFSIGDGSATVDCLAFEPTKRFRDHVRRLRRGDRVVACGEVGRGALKLEKFALVDPVCTERVPPTCPECDRRMKSAGRGQGYRCRRCRTRAPGKVSRPLERRLDRRWYEVPPEARRHLSKPLTRTGGDRGRATG